MKIHIRNRTIRPSTRKEQSKYRIQVKKASVNDLILIFIDHESKDFRVIYKCNGSLFENTDSIYFIDISTEGNIEILWKCQDQPELVPLTGNKNIDLDLYK